jgi:deoxyribonuclease (pyrimidine dimer)
VPPDELYDQHLIAEYREIRLLAANLRRSFASKKGIDKNRIPQEFTLMSGHILFFADKGKYIEKRYKSLQEEMLHRGFTPQYKDIDTSVWPREYFNDWQPTERDYKIIRARIASKVAMKPEWYRYYGKRNKSPKNN